jgi:hypothetical protein
MRRLEFIVRGAVLVSAVVATYLLLNGRVGAVVVALLGAVILALAIRRLPAEVRSVAGALTAAKFSLQFVLATTLSVRAAAEGHSDYVIGDDGTYFNAAWTLVEYLRGEIPFGVVRSLSELLGTYTYAFAALLMVFGRDPLIGAVLNVIFSSALVLVVFDLCRRLSGIRPAVVAAAAIGIHPSLALWSAVSLKDPLILLISTLVFWTLLRFHQTKRWEWLVLSFVLIVPLDSLRRFLFIGLVPLVVLGVAITPELRRASRIRRTAAAAALGAILLAVEIAGWSGSVFPTLATLESKRFSTTFGAKSAFVEAVPAETGQTFVINPLVAPSPGAGTSSPSPEPTVVLVSPGTRLVVAYGALPSPSAGTTYVRPGDVVVVGPAGTTPRPASERVRLDLPPDRQTATLVQGGSETVGQRTLAHLPRGLLYVLYAPFPWDARRLVDLATIPEMLLWYLAVPAAAYSLWRARARWQLHAPLVMFLLGTAGLMALAEGNVGTLFRHRAMIIPGVLLLAAPVLSQALERSARWARPGVGLADKLDT